jgi:GNAT superfamily N-acetyltransferase
MPLSPAAASDLPAVVALVNGAYRGAGGVRGWTHEAEFLDGSRTTLAALAEDLAAQPGALLTYREAPGAEVVGCVWLEPGQAGAWYLGMLTVRPDLQANGLGRVILAEAEALARTRGAARIRMTVVNIRDSLLAWYARRGYALTGETQAFPYDDARFGRPLREDLAFLVLEKAL